MKTYECRLGANVGDIIFVDADEGGFEVYGSVVASID